MRNIGTVWKLMKLRFFWCKNISTLVTKLGYRNFLKTNAIYLNGRRKYYGNTGRTFKKRFYEHQEGIRHKNSKKQTALSNFCWKLKEKGSQYEIKWSIKTKAHPYTAGAKACDLCLSEKLAILQGEKKTMLNSRNEIMSKCRHKFKYCLANVK